jgi:hypothetical protein
MQPDEQSVIPLFRLSSDSSALTTMIHGACPLARFVHRLNLGIYPAHAQRSPQLLAIFIVIQPALSTSTLLKGIVPWFSHLTWVQICCCCRCSADKRRRRVPRQSRESTLVDDYEEVKLGSVPLMHARTLSGDQGQWPKLGEMY